MRILSVMLSDDQRQEWERRAKEALERGEITVARKTDMGLSTWVKVMVARGIAASEQGGVVDVGE